MNTDWVFWGSIGTVILTAIIIGYIGIKIKTLMDRDAQRHKH